MENMKECPFCGGEPLLRLKGGRKGIFIFVTCDVCGAMSKTEYYSDHLESDDESWSESYPAQKAIRGWNRRIYDAE